MQAFNDKLDSFLIRLLEARMTTILSQISGEQAVEGAVQQVVFDSNAVEELRAQVDELTKKNVTLATDLDESTAKMFSLQEEVSALKEVNAEAEKTVRETLENNKPVEKVVEKLVHVPPTAHQIEAAAEMLLKRKSQLATEAANFDVSALNHHVADQVDGEAEPREGRPEYGGMRIGECEHDVTIAMREITDIEEVPTEDAPVEDNVDA